MRLAPSVAEYRDRIWSRYVTCRVDGANSGFYVGAPSVVGR